MAEDYRLRQGDCLDSIACDHGLLWETVWQHPANSQLRETRQDPFVLLPGDRLHIPDPRLKNQAGATAKRHRFRRKGVPSRLVVVLLEEGEPRAGLAYTLEIDGRTLQGTTDGQGRLEHPIVPNARRARLLVGDPPQPFEIDLGHLDPADTPSGQQARLANLGLYAGPVDGRDRPEFAAALAEFQERQGLSPTGVADQATRDKLKEAYGC